LSRGEKRVLRIWFILILVGCGIPLIAAVLVQSIPLVAVALGIIGFELYWFYVRYYQKKKPRYPLVSPDGKPDIYLPRTDIPRPIYEDFYRMQEKKRKFAKLDKWKRKRNKKKA